MAQYIFKILELSTGHLPEATAAMFDAPEYMETAAKRPTMAGEYGWLFVVPETDEMETTEAVGCEHFTNCIRLAQEKDCHYLMFDNIFLEIESLETFDW